MLKALLVHWQSTLFGFLTGVTGALYAATQKANLTPAEFWSVLGASVLVALKGAVSADANKV